MNINWRDITIFELALMVSDKLTRNNINNILVGGACVSIYSENKYISKDLDFVSYSSIKEIRPLLEELGLIFQFSNRFYRDDCPFYIEFLPYPVTIGSEIIIDRFNLIEHNGKKLNIITPTDSVKDRLAAYFFWNDTQALEQAILITETNQINLQEIQTWAENEDELEKFNRFLKQIKKKQ